MRTSASQSLRPLGWGFSFLVLLALAVPAHASSAVTLAISAADPSVVAISCPVTVPDGADGIAVLDAAVKSGCIDSYHTIHYNSFGDFVTCINHVCDLPWHELDQTTPADSFGPLFWEMTVDGKPTCYGVNGFRATNGKTLGFTFTTWVPSLVLSLVLPPEPCVN